MPTSSLSLCMIVKDEAQNLPRCLDSVQAITDEIIVVDTGSTDDTVAIAQSYRATVHHFPWGNDFSAARNHALQFVSSDWILVLDADEALSSQAIPALQQAIQLDSALVINLMRQEIGAAQSPYSLVSRLFRRHPQIQFSRPYHALIDDSVAQLRQQEAHWQVIELPEVAILHYGYEPGAIASRNKLQTAKTTMEGFWKTHPDDAYVCSKLGALYVQLGNLAQGIQLLEHGLKFAQSDPAILYELHYHLGIAHSAQNPAQAIYHYQHAIQQPIRDRLKLGAYNNLGSLLKAQGDLSAAQSCYQATLQITPDFAIGHYNLGMTYRAQGNLPQAIAHYQTALQLNPTHAQTHQNLGVALLKLGRIPESLEAFQKAIALLELQQSPEAERLRKALQEMGLEVRG